MSDCYKILTNSLGLDAATAKAKVREIEDYQKRLKLSRKSDALGKSVDEVAQKAYSMARIQAYNKLLTLEKLKDIGLDRASDLEGKEKIFRRFLNKTAADKHASEDAVRIRISNFITKHDAWAEMKNPEFGREIANAMEDEDLKVSPKARALADEFRNLQDDQKKMLNLNGAFIGFLDGYITRQMHEPVKMISATGSILGDLKLRGTLRLKHASFKEANDEFKNIAYERWRNNIYPMLDDRTFEDVRDPEKFLRSVYDNVTRQSHFNADDLEVNDFSRAKTLASRVSEERKLFFKKGKWVDYNEMYGSGTVQGALYHTAERNASNLALMRNFGPNPDALFNHVNRNILGKSDANMLKYQWDEITGLANIPVDALVAKIGSSLRAVTSLIRLGGVVISALPDLNNRMVMMKSNGVGFLDGYHWYFKHALSIMKNDEEAKLLASMCGVYGGKHIGTIANRFWNADEPIQFLQRASSTFFKFNFLHQWDYLNQTTAAMGLAKNLAQLRNKSFEQLPQSLQDTLDKYFIDSKDWDALRTKGMKPYGNELFLTPEAADQLTDEEAAQYASNKNSFLKADQVRDELKAKLQAYFHGESQLVSLTPDEYDRAFIHRGTRRGTLLGEFTRFVGQFKYYNLAFTRKIVKPALFSRNSGMWTGAQFIVSAAALGYISFAASSFLRTGQIPDPLSADRDQEKEILAQSFLQGGGFGLYSSWLANWSGSLTEATGKYLTPAAVEPVGDAYSVVTNAVKKFVLNDPKAHPAKAAMHFLREDVPFVNTFYAKAAFDHLLLNDMMNRVDPGYMDNKARKYQQQYNGQYLF